MSNVKIGVMIGFENEKGAQIFEPPNIEIFSIINP
jgi:hypothetical protein